MIDKQTLYMTENHWSIISDVKYEYLMGIDKRFTPTTPPPVNLLLRAEKFLTFYYSYNLLVINSSLRVYEIYWILLAIVGSFFKFKELDIIRSIERMVNSFNKIREKRRAMMTMTMWEEKKKIFVDNLWIFRFWTKILYHLVVFLKTKSPSHIARTKMMF